MNGNSFRGEVEVQLKYIRPNIFNGEFSVQYSYISKADRADIRNSGRRKARLLRVRQRYGRSDELTGDRRVLVSGGRLGDRTRRRTAATRCKMQVKRNDPQ